MTIKTLREGETNRSECEKFRVGGKGINVSLMLKDLGIETVALGIAGGFTGRVIMSYLEEQGVKSDFIYLPDGFTRINIKLEGMKETEINSSGKSLNPESRELLTNKISIIHDGDTLIISGSIPPPDKKLYELLCDSIKGRNIRLAVDTSGEALDCILKYKPFLIKPNKRELEEVSGKQLTDLYQIREAAQKLRDKGAGNVLVTLGGKGALLVSNDGNSLYCKPIAGKVISTIGAGDASVAGFIAGYDRYASYTDALLFANCAGAATAFSEATGRGEQVYKLFESLRHSDCITEIK